MFPSGGRANGALPTGDKLVDWKTLYLDPKGRIGQKDFWIGAAILFVAGIVLGLIPMIGWLISLALLYGWICLTSKRLHDFGKTGKLALIPVIAQLVVAVVAAMGMMAAAGASYGGGDAAGMAAMGALGFAGVLTMLAGLLTLAFLLWVGLTKGDAGANAYGEPRATALIKA